MRGSKIPLVFWIYEGPSVSQMLVFQRKTSNDISLLRSYLVKTCVGRGKQISITMIDPIPFLHPRIIRYSPSCRRQLKCEELHLSPEQLCFWPLDKKLVLPYCIQNCSKFRHVFRWVICLCVYEHIITIDHAVISCDVIKQRVIHESLKTTWCVGQAKWACHPFVLCPSCTWGGKSCLVLVTFSYLQLMKSWLQV